MIQTIDNVTCAACGLICEDVTLRVDNNRIVRVENACPLCEARLMDCSFDETGSATIDGKSTSPSAAIERAVELLASARAPLICGLAGSTIETQRAAVALADHLGATIDPAIPAFHRDAIVAMQSVGISTCTMGEVKQRADVVLFWGADPTATHPLLYERFLDPPGTFVSQGRHLIAVGARENNNRVDEFLQIDKSETLSVLTALRAIIGGIEVSQELIGEIRFEQLKRLASRLQKANYSVIFFGPEIGDSAEIEAIYLLVRQLNAKSRSAAIGLSGTLCENVLTWQTGYPCGVNFALGYPRYDPNAYSASTLLERGGVDAVLMVGSKGLEEMSPAALTRLVKLPVILLENAGSTSSLNPTVRITTALAGVHCGGTIFRLDGVPLKLRALCESSMPTAASVLTAIQEGICTSCV